jgi:Holliday junction DNA helicase RuvA
MISRLSGVVVDISFDEVVIDVGGIGYGVRIPVSDVSNLQKNKSVTVFVSEVIREQSYELYGFVDERSKVVFERVIKVNGVGARIAIALIGLQGSDALVRAISSSDVGFIVATPGVGKKLAERICTELRGVFVESSIDLGDMSGVSSGSSEASEALHALGFKSDDISRMLRDVDPTLRVEDQIKLALKEK